MATPIASRKASPRTPAEDKLARASVCDTLFAFVESVIARYRHHHFKIKLNSNSCRAIAAAFFGYANVCDEHAIEYAQLYKIGQALEPKLQPNQ